MVEADMDIAEVVQGYCPSSASSLSVPGSGYASSPSTSILDPGSASSVSPSVPGVDSVPIAPSNSSRFPKPVGKVSEGKENRKATLKCRGPPGSQNALNDLENAICSDELSALFRDWTWRSC